MRGRTLVFLASLALATGGCGLAGQGGKRALARNALVGVAIASVATAVGAAVVSQSKESALRDDLVAGRLDGRQFADRDAEGLRWNRAARASAFVGGLALVGLGILWEMGVGDRIEDQPPAVKPARDEGTRLPPLPPPGAAR